jgi:hypothetical protein
MNVSIEREKLNLNFSFEKKTLPLTSLCQLITHEEKATFLKNPQTTSYNYCQTRKPSPRQIVSIQRDIMFKNSKHKSPVLV